MNLKILAKELNLSFSTVSKALRDSHEISPATKQRVLEKAKELNYQVNPLASNFRKQKSKTIAVIIPEVVNDFFGPVINGIESIAQEKGYHVLIYLTHDSMQKELEISKLLQNGRVDGIMISLASQTSNTDHLNILKEKEIPLVFFDRIASQVGTPVVITDDYHCGFIATEHLIANGCKRIAFLTISENLSISNDRKNGYLDALKANNIKHDQSLIRFCNEDDISNKDNIKSLFSGNVQPDGIFASVEKLAVATYQICEELALNIPKDVKVITFSNSYMAALLNPPLSTITHPAFEMGRESATILFKLIEKKGLNRIPEKTVLKSNLIIRASSVR